MVSVIMQEDKPADDEEHADDEITRL